jgi:hypothetical protein
MGLFLFVRLARSLGSVRVARATVPTLATGAALLLAVVSVLGILTAANQATAQGLGGRSFTLTSRGGGTVDLSWSTGTGQTGYRLSRISAGGTFVVAPSLAGTATSFTDQLGPSVSVACYQLEILNGTNVVGRSDVLCVIVNLAGGTHAPRNVSIFTNETPAVGIRWDAPAQTSPPVIGYLVIPLGRTPLQSDGNPVFAPGNRVALDTAPGRIACYMVLALISDSAAAPFRIAGFSDIVCATTGTFSPLPTGPTATRTPTATLGGPAATLTPTSAGLTPTSSTTATSIPAIGSATETPTSSAVSSPSVTPSLTPSQTASATITASATSIADITATILTRTPSATPCFDCPTATPTITPTPCPACATNTSTTTPTITQTATITATAVAGLTWTSRASMPTARFFAAGALGADQRIYVFGGGHHGGDVFNVVEAYDPSTNTWSTRASMPTARVRLAAATAPGGTIFVVGGATASGVNGVALTALEAYDPVTNTWTTRAPMPTARYGLALVTAPNGRLYAIGGYSTSADQALGFVEEYNPATDQWVRRADMPTARVHFGATLGPDGRVYVAGGDLGGFSPQTALEVYNPATDTWETETPIPTARPEVAAATAAARIFVVGGLQINDELRLVEEYSTDTDTWVRRSDMIDRRRAPVLVTASGRLYAIGGFGGSDLFGTTINSVEEGTPF